MSNIPEFHIRVSNDEGVNVHEGPLKYPVKITEGEPCWYSYFKYDRWLHLQLRQGKKEVIEELDRLANVAMSPEGLTIRNCPTCAATGPKYLCFSVAVQELLTKALKGELQ